MNEITKHENSFQIGLMKVRFWEGRDIVNGEGWFCHAYYNDFRVGIAHSKNKFDAISSAIFALKT